MHQHLGLAFGIHQRGLRAVVEAVQQAIAVLPHLVDTLAHPRLGHAEHDQRVGGQHQARLEQFRHHGAGAGCTQLVAQAVVAGADQNRNLTVEMTCGFQHAHGHIGLVDGDDQQACPVQTDGLQQLATA